MTLIPHTHEPAALPSSGPVFDAENIQLQRRMRFNPLRTLDPENLSLALDQFELGLLRQAALLWEAIARRDDTLAFVKGQLENAIAGKPWGVFKKKGADPREAARHARALEYFYDNVTAVDAFDRNRRGGLSLLLRQMGSAASYSYAVHHFVWQPQPGRFLEVPGAAPVPALRAELEHVPLWFFENVTGTLRFLPYGGFGVEGRPLDWDGEWMVTTGAGVMCAASICHVFKRLTFQDWTIFNERYAQAKVLGQTNARKDTEEGRAMRDLVENFNSDMGMVIYESQPGDKPPISLVGPQGSVSADLFERFLDRQDRKLTVLYRGSDLRNLSRLGDTIGVSAQTAETDSLEVAHCHNIADACRTYIDRAVIKYCFGEGIEPLAYFGLPNHDAEDTAQVRANAGFLADRGALVELNTIAERLGITLTDDPAAALQVPGGNSAGALATANASYKPSQHPRTPAGTRQGGWFVPKTGALGPSEPVTARHLPSETPKAKTDEPNESRRNTSTQPERDRGSSALAPGREAVDYDHLGAGAGPGPETPRGDLAQGGGELEKRASRGGTGGLGRAADLGVSGRGGRRGTRGRGSASGGGRRGGSENASVTDGDVGYRGRGQREDADGGRANPEWRIRLEEAEAAAGHLHDDQFAAGHRQVKEARENGQLPKTAHNPALERPLESGEHHVEFTADGKHVLKHTKYGRYGIHLDVDPFNRITHRRATPLEYLKRLSLQNRSFHTGFRLIGAHAHEGGGLTVLQPRFKEWEPNALPGLSRDPRISWGDIEDYMKRRGYRKIQSNFLNRRDGFLRKSVYFNPATGHVVGDARPINFIRVGKNRIRPIDLMMTQADPGSRLRRVLMRAISG